MTGKPSRSVLGVAACVVVAASGCAFQGVNSLPLPGAVGRGPGAKTYHVEIANVATLEPNSPVMLQDVIVGSIGKLTVRDWHADVEISVQPDIVIPANAVASIGQTSLLGSMHLALNPPLGQAPTGELPPGSTIELNDTSTYPTTEQTLSSLAAVVNGGGLGQIGDVIHNFSASLNGREDEVRDLLTRLDNFVGVLDTQRENIVASIESLNRLSATFAGQRDVITRALDKIPPALDVLVSERPRLTTALQKLGTFGETARQLANDSQADLVTNLKNLEPALKALADIGPELDRVIAYVGTFPYTQSFIDRGIRGDYYNLFATVDLTVPKLKSTLMLGTRWEEEGAQMVPAPGDPFYQNYTYDPLKTGAQPPPEPQGPPGSAQSPPQITAAVGPVLPLVPPPPPLVGPQPVAAPIPGPDAAAPIFAGPYYVTPPSPPPGAPTPGGR